MNPRKTRKSPACQMEPTMPTATGMLITWAEECFATVMLADGAAGCLLEAPALGLGPRSSPGCAVVLAVVVLNVGGGLAPCEGMPPAHA